MGRWVSCKWSVSRWLVVLMKPQINRVFLLTGGMENTAKYIEQEVQNKRGVKFLPNSPSSFFSAKEHFSCCRTAYSQPVVVIAVVFSNYYALFTMFIICNVYF